MSTAPVGMALGIEISDILFVSDVCCEGRYNCSRAGISQWSSQQISISLQKVQYVGQILPSSSPQTLPKPTSHTMTTPALPQNCIVLCQAEFKINDQSLIHFSKAWLLPRDDIATIDVPSLRASLP